MRALASKIGAALNGFYELIGVLCGLLIGWVALSITIDVVIRNLRWGTLSWAMEVNEYAIYVVTALGAPWALYRGAHVRVDLIVKGVPTAIGRWMEGRAETTDVTTSDRH